MRWGQSAFDAFKCKQAGSFCYVKNCNNLYIGQQEFSKTDSVESDGWGMVDYRLHPSKPHCLGLPVLIHWSSGRSFVRCGDAEAKFFLRQPGAMPVPFGALVSMPCPGATRGFSSPEFESSEFVHRVVRFELFARGTMASETVPWLRLSSHEPASRKPVFTVDWSISSKMAVAWLQKARPMRKSHNPFDE